MFKRNPKKIGIRDVDLNRWVDYEVIGKAKEFESRVKAENPEFNLLWEEIEYLKTNRFIFETNEDGIKRYENLLEITNPKTTLRKRQEEVYILWNKQTIWTHRSLEEWLSGFIGKENYKIELMYDEYIAEFVIFMRNKTEIDYELLNDQLRKIIPANLLIRYRLLIEIDSVLETRLGDYNYPIHLCGLYDTGTIPRIRWEGQATNIDVNLDTAIDDAKNYKPLAGERHTATQLNNDKVTDTINMTSFGSDNVYSFEK